MISIHSVRLYGKDEQIENNRIGLPKTFLKGDVYVPVKQCNKFTIFLPDTSSVSRNG